MRNLKLAKQSDRYLLLFVLASTLIHSLSLFVFQMYKPSQLEDKDKTASKPIEFVVIPPKESSEKPPLETQKRSLENLVAKQSTQPQKTAASQVVGEPLSPKVIAQPFPPFRILKPKPDPPQPTPRIPRPEFNRPQPRPPIPIPKPDPPQPTPPIPKPGFNRPQPRPPIPIPKPKSEQSPFRPNPLPVSKPEQIPENQLESKDSTIATRIPPPPKVDPKLGTASLLGGNYKRSLNDGKGDDFLNPEELTQQTALNPKTTNALKDVDLSQYFAEIQRRVEHNWNPSQAVEEYTTELAFDIEKNGQITGLKVIKSSGSAKVDRESLSAVQNSAPFAPLPASYPMAALEVEFGFNIYIH